MLLSALWTGLGQLARGQTNRGLALLTVGTLTGTLGGVTGWLLRVLTLGRVKILPAKLNALALVWLGVYLYNLYDAYNLATGAEDDEDLFEYEEYEPQAAGDQTASGIGDAVSRAASGARDAVARLADTAGSAVAPVVDKAKDAVAPVVDQAKDAAAPVVDQVKDTAASVADSARDAAAPVVDQVKEAAAPVVDQVKDTATNVADNAGDAMASAVDQAKDVAAPVVDQMKDTATNVADNAGDAMASAVDQAQDAAGSVSDKAQDAVASAGDQAQDAAGSDLANVGNVVADLGQAASQLATGGESVGQGRAEANTGPVGAVEPPRESVTGVPPATTAGAHSTAEANRAFDFSSLGFPWEEGITKAQLLDLLGDDPQVLGVFGQYLPSDRVFHTEEEVLTLIPVQAWQSAQGRTWTGGDLPNSDQPTGYGDSAAGRLPPGETSADTA